MNYIIHINNFLERAKKEDCIRPSHISLYMALFDIWNKLGFRNPFLIHRETIMREARIGSKKTYYSCLKKLEEKKYIRYYKSTRKFALASVSIVPLCSTQSVPLKGLEKAGSKLVSVPKQDPLLQTNKKNNKNIVSNKPTMDDIVSFFREHDYSTEKALRFWYHNESTSWMTGNTPIRNWQAMALKWMLNNPQKTSNENTSQDFDDVL